jgi:hypothetical protein
MDEPSFVSKEFWRPETARRTRDHEQFHWINGLLADEISASLKAGREPDVEVLARSIERHPADEGRCLGCGEYSVPILEVGR